MLFMTLQHSYTKSSLKKKLKNYRNWIAYIFLKPIAQFFFSFQKIDSVRMQLEQNQGLQTTRAGQCVDKQ